MTIFNKARREYTLIKALGITTLVILMLVATAGAAPFAYVTSLGNSNNGTVSVIDTATDSVTATLEIENWPVEVAVNPAGTKVYVTKKLRKK